jgi:arylsulfatase A-like enzyme
LLSIDALRWDATHLLVETRKTVGAHLTLTSAVSPAPRTVDSLAATLRGRPVRQLELSRLEALRIYAPLEDASPTLGDVLASHGYRTMFIPSHRYLDGSTRITAGFETLVTPSYEALRRVRPGLGQAEAIVRSTEAFDRLLSELRETPESTPVLALAHLMESHDPYYWGENDFGPDDREGYLRSIAYVDRQIAQFLRDVATVRRHAPIVVLLGDHGEEHGEHGGRWHASSVYAEQARIGFVMAGPNVPVGDYDGPIGTTALPATLLELLGLPPGPFLEPSFLACVREGTHCPEVAVTELRHKGRTAVGYTTKSHRLIYNPVYDVEELFDLHRDPYERTNLAETDPDALEKARSLARRWDEQH